MKKTIVLTIMIVVVGLIIFTLFKNRAEMQSSAKPHRRAAYPVSVTKVVKQELNQRLSFVGLIDANNDVAVVSELQGKATAIMADEGSYITAGSPIVKLEDQIPEANFLAAQTNYEKAQKDWERSNSLYQEQLISATQLESSRQTYKLAEAAYVSAQRQYHNSTITSPISGIITTLPINVGTMVTQGMTVANVVDISKLKVKINVDEQNVFKLKVGDIAEVETDVYPGVKFLGKIENISAKGDAAHTYPVKVMISNNKQHPLKSGMFSNISINLGTQIAVAIPRDALVGSPNKPQVFIVKSGKAKLQDIRIGSEIGTQVTVVQGLNEGDNVVISGQDNLKENVQVDMGKNKKKKWENNR